MGRYKEAYAERLVSKYIQEIEKQKTSIMKNFNDMDFANANTRDEFESIANSMVNTCNSLISEISSYSFD
jgi:flagellar biosynthesis/type III secretory pathway chaperone